MAKFWQTVKFWTKIKLLVAACGSGGELTLILREVAAEWHVLTIVATILGLFLTQFIEDKNNNGIVDALEREEKVKKDEQPK